MKKTICDNCGKEIRDYAPITTTIFGTFDVCSECSQEIYDLDLKCEKEINEVKQKFINKLKGGNK